MHLRLMRFRSNQLSNTTSASAKCVPDESMAFGTGGNHEGSTPMHNSCIWQVCRLVETSRVDAGR